MRSAIAARLPSRIGLDEREMAASLSLSVGTFRKLVDAGLMPKPRVAFGRKIYDPEEAQIALRRLPREGGDESELSVSFAARRWQ